MGQFSIEKSPRTGSLLSGNQQEGARNALALWRDMRAMGFPGQSGVVSQWAQRRRSAEKANQSGLARTPSTRVIARLMTAARDDLAKPEAILVAAIEVNVPELVIARTAIGEFQVYDPLENSTQARGLA